MEDLISREALRKAMYHEAMEKDSNEQRWDSGCWIRYKMFERVLKHMPSAQAERKKGKWIEEKDPYDFFDSIPVCSECGYTNRMRMRYNFCPNCGADMRGEQNG